MSVFLEISRQHSLADATFEAAIVNAYGADDDAGFDQALKDRTRNDQAYFLFLFTRLEDAINEAFLALVSTRAVGLWADVRAWSVWDGKNTSDIQLMLKVSLLLQKGNRDYNDVKAFYAGRNTIAHGRLLDEPFAIAVVARRMHDIATAFAEA